MYHWLDDAVTDGATVITSSRRLARTLRAAHDAGQLAAGRRSWRTPDILYWQDWLVRTLDSADLAEAPLLLPAPASLVLWEQCLSRTSPADVLSSSAVARHARQAWQRLLEWRVPLRQLARAAGTIDERWFARAAGAYEKRLRTGNWIDLAELPGTVADLADSRTVALPSRIVHSGFDRISPALEHLFERIAGAGCSIDTAPPPGRTASPETFCYADTSSEWRAAGAAARRMLLGNPSASVAIVAPDLESGADTVARLVREGFAPGWQFAGGRHRASVDVSYGRRLSDFPLISVALLCLKWTQSGLFGRDLGIVLRSPFVGADDLAGRCRLERFLRSLPDREWGVRDFLAVCRGRRFAEESTGWQQRLSALAELQAQARLKVAPAEWASRIDTLLSTLGWPGIAHPDSDEFQLINRWRQLLNELAGIAVIRPTIDFAEAVRRLAQIAAETVYQPESRAGAVQLLGNLEAAGMEFDHLWIGGLDALHWPPPSHPLALVSRTLQREFGMPDATPGETLEFARQTFERRLASASSISLSWPRADQDAELAPSPLLPGDAVPEGAGPDDPGWYAAALQGSGLMETVDNDTGPAVDADEKVGGGAYTVQRQAEDPFSAFASARLGVSELERFQSGLSARQRGILLHRALQLLFEDHPSQRQIAAWSDHDRDTRIARAIDASLGELRRHGDSVLHRLILIERRRMQSLLREFVAEELRRDEFSIVDTEQRLRFQHGPVTLDLRIDRVDRLADGSALIIDYKSGSARNLLKQSGDLADMQLGVYASAMTQAVGGLLLINLDSRAIVYKGAGGSVPWGRVDADAWPSVLAAWRNRVDELLTALADGDLRINVRLPGNASRALSVLSRIEELKRGH